MLLPTIVRIVVRGMTFVVLYTNILRRSYYYNFFQEATIENSALVGSYSIKFTYPIRNNVRLFDEEDWHTEQCKDPRLELESRAWLGGIGG